MPSINFLKSLQQKLKFGTTRTIHLNALPGRYARLDVCELNHIQENLSESFINSLTGEPNFKFRISVDRKLLDSDEEKDSGRLKLLLRKLNLMHIQETDEYLEYGIRSFGFGFPLLVKRDEASGKVIKAPLLIWNLDISPDMRKANTWVISRNEEQPILFNEVLRSYLEVNNNIKLDELSVEILEDRIADKNEIVDVCKRTLEQLNSPNDLSGLGFDLEACLDKKTIEANASDTPSVLWCGVFGLYKNQKQSIIDDYDRAINGFENLKLEADSEKLITEAYTTSTASVDTDPSQENILNSLRSVNDIIIQGPPGTGKSQSITAILTNVLEQGKKCLVVCEKKTALDVIYSNLRKIGLEGLAAIIDDVNIDRKEIVNAVRNITDNKGVLENNFRVNNYETTVKSLDALKKEVNGYYNNITGNVFGDNNAADLVGLFLKKDEVHSKNVIGTKLPAKHFSYVNEEYNKILPEIRTGQALFSKIDSFKHPLDVISPTIFDKPFSYALQNELHEELVKANERVGRLRELIKSNNKLYGNRFNGQSPFNNFIISVGSIFSAKLKSIKAARDDGAGQYNTIRDEHGRVNLFQCAFPNWNEVKFITNISPVLDELASKQELILNNLEDLKDYFEWKHFLTKLEARTRDIILLLAGINPGQWDTAFESWYFDKLLLKLEEKLGPFIEDSQKLEEMKKLDDNAKSEQANKIKHLWAERLTQALNGRMGEVKALYNKKGGANSRRNSLRAIIHKDFKLFTDFFPALLVNPNVCSSILPLEKGLFDYVIFDEASQLRLEDTYPSLIRGKGKIVSGDKHQMPPSNYFTSTVVIENDNELIETEEVDSDAIDTLSDSESLLKFAEDSSFEYTYLDFHYRSRHPGLIDFSNAAFYGSRLIPMPAVESYTPIKFIEVNGVYEKNTNPGEVQEIIDILKNDIAAEGDSIPSIGIATLNITQRNLILETILEECYKDNEFAAKYDKMKANGFFVKNLENIQGDERDIIIISTTFGKDSEGGFRQFFGPINQEKGYKLLNVIITRAKHKIYLCTSIPSEYYNNYAAEIESRGNTGKGIFYSYIAYAKAVSENDIIKKESLLKLLQEKCSEQSAGGRQASSSYFKDSLAGILPKALEGFEVKQDVSLGGLNIDFVISHPSSQKKLAIECDGAHYHAHKEAYKYDLFKKTQLEKQGYTYYKLWINNWWQRKEREIERIKRMF